MKTAREIGVIAGLTVGAILAVATARFLHRHWDAQQKVKNESPRQKRKQKKNSSEMSEGTSREAANETSTSDQHFKSQSTENSESEAIARQEHTCQFSERASEKDGWAMSRHQSAPAYQEHRDPPPPYSETPTHRTSSDQHLQTVGPTTRAFYDNAKAKASKTVESGKICEIKKKHPDLTKPKIEKGTSDEEDESQLEIKDNQKEPNSNQEREKILVREYKVKSVTGTFSFEVDERGCCVDSQYCKLQFPPGATKRPLNIKMTPEYKSYVTSAGEISICPIVNFTSDDDLVFEKSVTVGLHTNYTAVEGKVSVQVIWRRDCFSPFETFVKNLQHGNERFVTFDTKHFCGLCVVASENQLQNMERHYYSAVYVRRPEDETTRYLHWLIHEDCPSVTAKVGSDLKDKDVLIDSELFSLRYQYNLQLSMTENERRGGEIDISLNDQRMELSKMWGSRVSESFQLKVMKTRNHQGKDSQMHYELLAMHSQNRGTYSVRKKPFFLQWYYHAPDMHVNVLGKHATGVSNTFQHQISNVSTASSGYTSDSQASGSESRFFGEQSNVIPESEQSMVHQDIMEEEQEDQVVRQDSLLDNGPDTIPISEAEDFGSFMHVLRQSTPNSTGAETTPKEREESMDSMDKAFQ